MTAAIGFPTLRLIRYAIEDLTIDAHGQDTVKEWTQAEIFDLLNLKKLSGR